MILNSKIINIPTFNSQVKIFVVENITDLNKKYNLKVTDDYDSFVFENYKDYGFGIVIKRDTTNYVIAHECVHLTNYIFKHTNIKLDVDNDETQAYLTGYLFKKIEKFRDKNRVTTYKEQQLVKQLIKEKYTL